MNRDSPVPRACYLLLCAVADALDTVLSFVSPTVRPPHSPSDIEHLTDLEICQLRSPEGVLTPDLPGYPKFRVTPNTMLKQSQDYEEDTSDACEANALRVLCANTTIPVPHVRRVFHDGEDRIIALEFIEGCTLAEAWPSYSVWRKLCVAFTLRRYLRQIRRFCKAPPGAPPGPVIVEGNAPRTCFVPSIFGEVKPERGPFAFYSDLTAFFNDRRDRAVPRDDPYRNIPFDDSQPLVLCHLDLNLRNIMADKDNRLWIIDWSWSGYYPAWFEYIATTMQSQMATVCGTDDYLWRLMIPFICDPYFHHWRWLLKLGRSLSLK
ncbi:hypothetical protein QCA50_003273 [Cerrena zonata]|uniref:Aminoglycoside phosphotransferase domain-containing protein n=1 Tax=Cerrena zonata TaxID=2478898 RepID=A0AAW0GUK3_9APHY